MRWLQETEARKARSRFRELRDMVAGLSTPDQQVPKTAAAAAAKQRTGSARGSSVRPGSRPARGRRRG